MNERKSRLRSGIFVALTLLLFLLMLFYFGLSQVFIRKTTVSSCFAESVQGLSVGSDVKYQGVKVGSVRKITILAKEKIIQVDMAVELKHFRGIGDLDDFEESENSFREFISNDVKHGLRCRLEFAGITGMKYVSLDYYAKADLPIPVAPVEIRETGAVYIPSMTSPIKDLMVAMTRSLDRLSKVNFEGIFDEVEEVLKELNSTLSAPEIKTTMQNVAKITTHLENTANSLNRVLSEKRMENMVDKVDKNLDGFGTLVQKFSTISSNMKLPETSAEIRNVANIIAETRQELAASMIKLNDMLDALRKLCDMISNTPGFLLGTENKSE